MRIHSSTKSELKKVGKKAARRTAVSAGEAFFALMVIGAVAGLFGAVAIVALLLWMLALALSGNQGAKAVMGMIIVSAAIAYPYVSVPLFSVMLMLAWFAGKNSKSEVEGPQPPELLGNAANE